MDAEILRHHWAPELAPELAPEPAATSENSDQAPLALGVVSHPERYLRCAASNSSGGPSTHSSRFVAEQQDVDTTSLASIRTKGSLHRRRSRPRLREDPRITNTDASVSAQSDEVCSAHQPSAGAVPAPMRLLVQVRRHSQNGSHSASSSKSRCGGSGALECGTSAARLPAAESQRSDAAQGTRLRGSPAVNASSEDGKLGIFRTSPAGGDHHRRRSHTCGPADCSSGSFEK